MRLPPSGIEPHRLFRLLAAPVVVLPLAYRLHFATDQPLAVCGLRAADVQAIRDDAEHLDPFTRQGATAAGIIAASLLSRGRPVFRSGREVMGLPHETFAGLSSAVMTGLGTISPLQGWSNIDAWLTALERGSRHPSNAGARETMRVAHDIVVGNRVVFNPRPDRYFGLPLCALTDGQLLAFRSCRQDL